MFSRSSLVRIVNLILVLPVALFVAGLQPVRALQKGSETLAQLDRFNLMTDTTGWVLLENHLFWTEDGGQSWREVGPSIPGGASVESIYFLNGNMGWMLWSMTNPDGLPLLQLARTQDGGINWTMEDLPLLTENIPDIEKVETNWFDPQTGWISVKQSTGSNFSIGALFTTRDGGTSWEQFRLPVADRVYFSDPLNGWAVGGPSGDQIFSTRDGGGSWQNVSIMDSPPIGNATIYPPLVSDGAGLLVATRLGPENFLDVYRLADPTSTWQPAAQLGLDVEPGLIGLSLLDPQNFVASIPGTHSIVRMSSGQLSLLENKDGLSSSITELDMVSMDTGWGRSIESNCITVPAPDARAASVKCSSTTQLLSTTDGGQTWKAVVLPSVSLPSSSPETLLGQETVASGTFAGWDNTKTLIGQGFDRCEIPTLSQMQTWSSNGPYKAVNLYIGGSSRACNNLALTASYLKQLYQQGWTFIPTWVGPQAPCTGFSSRMSLDPTTAYNQGVSQANLAVDTLATLGLTYPDKTGSVVYYDIEHYGTTNSACRTAVNAFMNGWVSQLHTRGNEAGVYASTVCNTGLADFLAIANVPDHIWAARWYHNQGEGYYDPDASVWTLGSCIPATVWASHQRVRQYEGAHKETWGALTMEIDSDVLDGAVAIPYAFPRVETITRLDQNPTDKTSVRFLVTFSRPVTGVDVTDFALTGTGLTGTSIPSISGSMESYIATVDTGTGEGKIRLDVKDNNSIKDGISNPLGGTGTTDGNFTNGETYTIRQTPTFGDVPFTHPYSSDIEILYANNLTGGCNTEPLMFCPDDIMNRGQAAAFMLRGNFGASFVPDPPQHIFQDDWTRGPWAEAWAEGMLTKGFSAGCLTDPLKYCPWDLIPREQAVIFALKLKYGKDYMAPPASGTLFADMTNPAFYATSWAEQAYKEGIITNCGMSGGKPKFCPKTLVSRGLAAYMIVRAKNLSMP